jgi:hypothetical protein
LADGISQTLRTGIAKSLQRISEIAYCNTGGTFGRMSDSQSNTANWLPFGNKISRPENDLRAIVVLSTVAHGL